MKLEKQKEYHLPTRALGLAVSADGARLYAACMDGAIFEVNAENGGKKAFEAKHDSFASGCELLPDGKTLVSAGYDGMLLWHDTETRKCFRRVKAHGFWSWKMALSPDGSRLASVTGQYLAGGGKYEPLPSEEPTVKVFDAVTGDCVKAFQLLPPVLSVAFSPDGRRVAAGNMMGTVRVWDLQSESTEPAAEFTSPDFTSWGTIKSHHYCGGIYDVSFSPDGAALLCCGMGPMADPMAGNGKMTWQRWAWRENPPKMLDQIRDGEHGAGLMETLAWRPGGTHFLMAGRQAQGTWNTAVFDAESGKLEASTHTGSRVTRGLFSSPDTLWLSGGTGQPGRDKNGKWGDFGKIYRYALVS